MTLLAVSRAPHGERHGDYLVKVGLAAKLMYCVVQGLIHISELSWSRISTPEMVVQPGSLVRCKVISVDREENRIGLSLKQMEADPLTETLESVLPAGEQPEFSEVPCDIPQTIEDICSVLKTTGGIEAVNLGRCAREKRAVSQVTPFHPLQAISQHCLSDDVLALDVLHSLCSSSSSPQGVDLSVSISFRSLGLLHLTGHSVSGQGFVV